METSQPSALYVVVRVKHGIIDTVRLAATSQAACACMLGWVRSSEFSLEKDDIKVFECVLPTSGQPLAEEGIMLTESSDPWAGVVDHPDE